MTKDIKLYNVWKTMRQRCGNPKKDKYVRYGARGIKVCNEWNSYKAFSEWAVENGYSHGLSIERINNDGNYEPSNCTWATNKQQQRNTSKSCIIEYAGKALTAPEWSEITGISDRLITSRKRRGWSPEKILTANINPQTQIVEACMYGCVTQTFTSIGAASRQLGIVGTHISACCLGKRKKAGGFTWRYLNGN